MATVEHSRKALFVQKPHVRGSGRKRNTSNIVMGKMP